MRSQQSPYEGLGLVMAVSAAGFSVILACICIYLVFYFMAVTRNAILDVTDAIVPSSETVKNIQPTCWYALTVAVISSLYNISPEEVLCEYTRDLDARQWIVRHSFPYNSLTRRFMNNFSSRFLSNGYDFSSTVTTQKTTVA
ncbi:hypothetical protein Q1695_003717 [Nippostrongylus brasiliensis]|nr:hypothetical protein Q1695_003717 [Nippostrongylus brasiliensis]